MSSCTTFQEHHFFKDEMKSDFPNYYKVAIKGHTRFMSKTRYYSGYFPSDAIDIYFNEFSQPRDGKLLDSTRFQSLTNGNKQLVMILSSNADDIANQIGNVTQTKNTLNAVMSLTNGSASRDLLTQQSLLETGKDENKLLIEVGESLLADIDTKSPARARADILQYINVLAASLGHSEPFRTINDARAWFIQGSFIKTNDR